MDSHIRHITLSTGHSRDSYRSEVSDEAVDVCADLIARITADHTSEPVRIPGVGDYYISGRSADGCLLATVWSGQPVPSLHDPSVPAPICTIGVAARERHGDRLWRMLHQWGEMPIVTDPDRCPPAPWIGVALDAGIIAHLGAAHWLGDFERCLGWAWIELQ
jgi:hypothetical protein